MSKRVVRRRMKHPAYGRFQGFLVENKIKLKDVARVIGSTPSTVSLKNNGYADYTMKEVNMICDAFGCEPSIFRAQKVS